MTEQELYTEIAEMVAVVRDCKAQIDAVETELKPRMDEARAKLEDLTAEYQDLTGKRWEDANGYAQWKAPTEYYSYPAKELNPLADLPEYKYLRDKRKLVKRKGLVEVK
jgi:hypothetical protein